MKRHICFIAVLCLLISLFAYQVAEANVLKWIRMGRLQSKVVDSADMGEGFGWRDFGAYDYNGFTRYVIEAEGYYLGVKDWQDPDGINWPVKVSSSGTFDSNELFVTIPVPDKSGMTIHNYYRYPNPSITVDGTRLDEPFPFDEADEVNPSKIPGTADQMIESWINTDMGLTIHQKVLSYSHWPLNEVIIYDWTFINTGNTDLDDQIELPNQTLKEFYFMRQQRQDGQDGRKWNTWYGDYMTDSLRISYAYNPRETGAIDDIGGPQNSGFLRNPYMIGEAVLWADKSAKNHTDDPSQPQMTWAYSTDTGFATTNSYEQSADNLNTLYEVMRLGFQSFDQFPYNTDPNVYPNTHHSLRTEDIAVLKNIKFIRSFPWWKGANANYYSCGPYTLAPKDSVRIVWAIVVGSICPEIAWKVGKEWTAKTCTFDTLKTANHRDNLPRQLLYFADLAPTENDRSKDRWVFTGRDSIFRNTGRAQWAVRNNYNIPTAPQAPSINVHSLPDKINISWGSESESSSNFSGYRVYRAIGKVYYDEATGVVVGKWTPIFACGAGTPNALTHTFDDKAADRGKAYFYYVSAFSNTGFESGKYRNMTTQAAYLTKPAGTLASVRVVPNPFNLGARDLQYPGEQDKIMFMDLPPVCTIKIYTQSLDLVRTIEHTNGSGDEAWGILQEEHSATQNGQIIVSGVYIAHIQTPSGENSYVKFVVVR